MSTGFKLTKMKMFQAFFPVSILVGLILASLLVRAEDDQTGFISIYCGIPKGSNYTDKRTGLKYVSDKGFIDSGEIRNVLPLYADYTEYTHYTTLNSFPENTKNCYTLKPARGRGNRYLIRVMFMYGNYDFYLRFPKFDVYLGPDYWDTIEFSSQMQSISKEIIYVAPSDYIHVCLVNTGHGTPFISGIELRCLETYMYSNSDDGPLGLFTRNTFEDRHGTIRYKADVYDRIWETSYIFDEGHLVQTNDHVTDFFADPPSEAMTTTLTPNYPNDFINITWDPVNATDKFFICVYFSEIEIQKSNQTREFNIYLNGVFDNGPLSVENNSSMTAYVYGPEEGAPSYTLTIRKTENSTLPPIINAYEIFTYKQQPQRQTDDRDASAMWSIKSFYGLKKHWQGDPCAPREFAWDGVKCNYTDPGSLRIIFLNLSASGLNGDINLGLANLTMIHTLDLSNNNLTGKVPKFLAGLNSLKVLNLNGNHFTGPLPADLLAKSNKGSLSLRFDGDIAGSCDTSHCKHDKGNKVIVPVIATVVSLFVILTALIVLWMIKRKKTYGTELKVRKQQYTYSEVQSITENFKVVLGKGGFGIVYHGHIDDTQVAVKILSESSLQGDKEFQAEANLLLGIHHKNITSLVGYCNEGSHKGIIYEFMSNGNLESHIFDASSHVSNWEERLRILCDAAHGLEYLHHGCKPGIVHRDIKCTNILLNETFQAKLADFGLSRAFPVEGGTHISTGVVGTPGYLDPEYYTSYRLTKKSDVFSFGVVLLVLITGQPAITKYENENIHIIRWVNIMLADGNVKNVVDSRLLGDFDINSAWKAVELALVCVDQVPNKRPAMNEVVMELNDCLVIEGARREMEPKKLTGLVSLNLESAYDPNPR